LNFNVPVSMNDDALAPPAGYGGYGYHFDGMGANEVGVTLPPAPPAPAVDINDSAATAPVSVDLGATGQHSVLGSMFNDTLSGGTGGGALLMGNDGNDILTSQGANDTLIGGNGGDIFTFTTPAAGGSVITDFGSSTDGIDLRPLLAAMHYQGADPFADGHVTTAAVAGGTAIMVSATGQATDAHLLVTVQGASTLHPWDFYH
jgi:Ca2+-binding RTX toxin-like protein